jgi:GNAT superfamily N-acetyltransferase
MDEEYAIVYVDEPEWGIIGQGINNYNRQQAGEDDAQSLCFVLKAPDQEIVGGVIGATYWDWFHLDLLWVKDDLRGRGHGHRLLTLAEDEARRRGARNAYLDTFSFQAPDFYEQHGYRIFGELQDFPPGHRRYFFAKQL